MSEHQEEVLDLDIEVPAPPPPRPIKDGITWYTYKVKNPVHCDACLIDVHTHWPVGTHAPNRAIQRRQEKGVDTYWCAVHAEQKREADGVSRAKPKKKAREV